MTSTKLVLLFGMPRSGTTWIGKLFDSHKDTHYLHEPDSVEPDFDIPLLLNKEAFQAGQLEKKVSQWLQLSAEKVVASRPFFKKSYMNSMQWYLFVLSAYGVKLSTKLKLPFCKTVIRSHARAPVTVWKSIESLGRAAAIIEHTQAKMIHIIRHPCGQIASTFRGEKTHQFDGSISTSEDWDLFDKLIQQSGEKNISFAQIKTMHPEERLAFRWGVINDFALKQLNKNNTIVLLYEDLCRDPQRKLTEIFNNVGLTLNQETLDYLKESTGKDDAAYYATRKTPLTAAYKWRDELSTVQQQRIAKMIKQFNCGKFYADDV